MKDFGHKEEYSAASIEKTIPGISAGVNKKLSHIRIPKTGV